MRSTVPFLFLCLAACGGDQDRLTDEQAAQRQAASNETLVAGDPNGGQSDLNASLTGDPGAVIYKAVGTEPGWALTVRERALLYQGDYGTVRVVEATPGEFRPAAGTFRTGRLSISIAAGPCSDGMSDHLYRHNVTVAVAGGRTARGCGGGLMAVNDPNAIEGTRFRVTAINGGAVPGTSNWWLSFADGKVSGQFGCNIFGATYRRNGDHLSLTSGLEQNAMGCAPSIEAWDAAGQRLLVSGPRIEKVGGIVRLVSEAGTMDLAPPPKETPNA